MHRAIPAVLITAAVFVLVWQFEPQPATVTTLPQTPVATSGGTGNGNQQVLDGTAEGTRWGTVQVRAVFTGGRLTDIQMLQTPNDRHATRAIPTLKAEALKAQSANIDTVSGATATSEAYAQSLQAAIDQRN
jgi:uncharacterized protein with FMN-binding domain